MVEYVVLFSNKKREELFGSRFKALKQYDSIVDARNVKERFGKGYHIYKNIGYTTQRSTFTYIYEKVE